MFTQVYRGALGMCILLRVPEVSVETTATVMASPQQLLQVMIQLQLPILQAMVDLSLIFHRHRVHLMWVTTHTFLLSPFKTKR
jgi:hypothetical protein